MTIWLDAQLPPSVAPWLAATFGISSVSVRDLGLRDALDPPIFAAARAAGAVVIPRMPISARWSRGWDRRPRCCGFDAEIRPMRPFASC